MTPYSYPIPSREAILATLRAAEHPLAFDALCGIFSLEVLQQEGLQKRLAAMERDGQLKINEKNCFQAEDIAQFIAGRVQAHRDGFGFLIRDDGLPDLFLSFLEMQKTMHNDRVLTRSIGYDRRGRPEARIVEVTEHANRYVVGRLCNAEGQWFVTPEDQRFRQDIMLAPDDIGQAQVGQIVTAELQTFPGRNLAPSGKITEILGQAEESGMEIEIAVRKYGVPNVFSEAALAQAAALPETVGPADHVGRTDLRALPFVTIDGEDARDFDDAVYGEVLSEIERVGQDNPSQDTGKKPKSGFRLCVAIADVSYYVRPNDALDRDALERSTSVYFPRRVLPMLPEKLSNGLCSLNPQVDRCALVCDMTIDAQGRVHSHRFYPALIHSAARLTYTTVAQVLEDPKAQQSPEMPALIPHLQVLHQLYQALSKARQKRGAMEFETTETKIVCDAHGKIECIIPSVRNVAHKLIEECMLAANVCAAKTLHAHKHLGLYRVHAQPDADKLINLRRFLGLLGLSLGGGEAPTATDYAVLMDQARSRALNPEANIDLPLLQTMLLRSMQQAVYSPENIGHFGLAYAEYAHFTSPIRRYPDLLTHRALYAILAGTKYHPHYEPEITLNTSMMGSMSAARRAKERAAAVEEDLQGAHTASKGAKPALFKSKKDEIWFQLGQHCSANERRADEASRDVESWLKCYFMRDKVGEIYTGAVSGVTSFGLFVQLDTLFIDGLVHVTELGSDYFQYDEVKNELVGERTGVRYHLLERLTVQVARVDLNARKIDFRLIEAPLQTGQKRAMPAASTEKQKRTKGVPAKKDAGDMSAAAVKTKKPAKAASTKKNKISPKAVSKKKTKKAPKAAPQAKITKRTTVRQAKVEN